VADVFETTGALRARPWFGHTFGIAGALFALWLRFQIGDGLVDCPFITFFPFVVLTAFLGGTGPGVLCAILSGLASWYFFVPPYNSFALEWQSGFIAMAFYSALGSTAGTGISNATSDRFTGPTEASRRRGVAADQSSDPPLVVSDTPGGSG